MNFFFDEITLTIVFKVFCVCVTQLKQKFQCQEIECNFFLLSIQKGARNLNTALNSSANQTTEASKQVRNILLNYAPRMWFRFYCCSFRINCGFDKSQIQSINLSPSRQLLSLWLLIYI